MKKLIERQIPERRGEDLIVRKVDDELLIYDRKAHQGFCFNQTMCAIWAQLDGKSTISEVLARLKNMGIEEIDESAVLRACDSLQACDLLVCPNEKDRSLELARRSLLKRAIGLNVVAIAPSFTTFTIPSAYAQASCVPKFGACNSDSECCPNCICTGAGFCSGNC